jgi:hypothetical protein
MRQLSKKDAGRYFSDPTKELQKILPPSLQNMRV